MRTSTQALVVLAATNVAAGLVLGLASFSPNLKAVDFALSIVTVACIYVWCRHDALERGVIPSGRFALWAAILSPVFVPVYFFRTRPALVAVKSSLKAYGFFIGVAMVGGLIAAMLGAP